MSTSTVQVKYKDLIDVTTYYVCTYVDTIRLSN